MNSFLYSLEKILESKSENVNVTQRLSDGSEVEINVPSFGYLKGKINDINTKFDTLISANDNVIGIKSSNGDVRKFELKKVSQLIQEMEAVKGANFNLPTSFGVKNNWFFESFLNPLLYVGIDVSSILTNDIDQFSVKRIIINSVDDDQLAFFDDNYKSQNDIDLDQLILDLEGQGIDYIEDDNVVPMPVSVNRFKGSFDVFKIYEETVDQVLQSTGETVSVIRRRYKLSTLKYTDILDQVDNTRILSEGEILITDTDSEYQVVSVDKTTNEVVLERIFGIEPITIGANILRIKPVKYREPELQVSVGYNEREVIFVRPISKSNDLTIDDYSNGFGVFTNELTISLEDDSEATLEQYYNNFVADFGLILLNAAKERKIPSIIGEVPDSPTLSVANFQVEQIDQHIKEDEDDTLIKNQIAEKENIKVRIKETLKKVDDLKAQLNDTQKTQAEKNRIDKKIKSAIEEKASLQTQLSSTVKNITLNISNTPAFVREPKYRVRGFWPIPVAKENRYGKQEIVQFKVRYRYLSKKGTAPNAKQSTISEGTESKFATFSPWTEFTTKPRTKQLDETTGLYTWTTENVADAEVVNTNQLDISIRKGETVEIQIKSISEAGWPDNPVESDWSDPVQVPFPEEIESAEEVKVLSQRTFAEEARLDFEDELTARGLDLHLSNQFTTGERFFSHRSLDIASGFFTNEGNIIDLYEKLKELTSSLEAVQQSISTARGVIKVSFVDDQGNVSEVKNGDSLKVFAGYYRDQIKETSGGTTVYNEGNIVTKQYIISIENTSATTLELITLLQGGIDQDTPLSQPLAFVDSDYHVNRRYDVVPLGVNQNEIPEIGSTKQVPSLQSTQVNSQFMHSRIKNYGLSEELYLPSDPATGYPLFFNSLYAYAGTPVGGQTVPANWGHYLPYNPTTATPITNPNVWNGTTDASGDPVGGGYVSEFAIGTDHPYLSGLGAGFSIAVGTNLQDTFRPEFTATVPPTIDADASQERLPFSHALHFETSVSEGTNAYGAPYYKQASRISPVTPTLNTARDDSHYPIKLGFTEDDKNLIGKYTCGAYLYMFPNNYEAVSVDGNHPLLSSKKIEQGSENSINIPVLFQYRCSDILGYVGGYRTNAQLNNIKYTKRIGIDIFVKDDTPFSFDIEATSQYKKETTLDSPIVPSSGSVQVNY
jgi:hypothetical protein